MHTARARFEHMKRIALPTKRLCASEFTWPVSRAAEAASLIAGASIENADLTAYALEDINSTAVAAEDDVVNPSQGVWTVRRADTKFLAESPLFGRWLSMKRAHDANEEYEQASGHRMRR